jgi:hypothetical protein
LLDSHPNVAKYSRINESNDDIDDRLLEGCTGGCDNGLNDRRDDGFVDDCTDGSDNGFGDGCIACFDDSPHNGTDDDFLDGRTSGSDDLMMVVMMHPMMDNGSEWILLL